MLLTTALDVLAAYLLCKVLFKWWAWLPAAFLTGAVLSLVVSLSFALFGYAQPGQAVIRGIAAAPIHAAICCLSAWFFAKRRVA